MSFVTCFLTPNRITMIEKPHVVQEVKSESLQDKIESLIMYEFNEVIFIINVFSTIKNTIKEIIQQLPKIPIEKQAYYTAFILNSLLL